MPVQHHRGKKGEQLASEYLTGQGYHILEQNWRVGKYEIDIIARHRGILVFVEVKTRTFGQYGRPEEMVSLQQWDRIAHTGGLYMRKIDYNWEVRFDIVAVHLFRDGTCSIKHYPDVFFPWA